jgi:hypothetical protein
VRSFEMFDNRKLGTALIIIGVLANNYVYLHDVVLGTHQGMIDLGWLGAIGIVITLVVTALGLIMLQRSRATNVGE